MTWRGQHVLVTGADGFMGSHLSSRLLAEGADVSVYVRYRSHAALGPEALTNLADVGDRLREIIWGDLAARDAVARIGKLAPDVVFHLAADAWVPRSFEHAREVVSTNVESTLNVLDAARGCPSIRRVVITSSSEVYGTAQTEQIDEGHPLEPTSPYAASKVACDRLAIAWHRTYGTPVAIIRPFNTYGPRHVYDVIPKFIRLALSGEPLTVHGTGEQSRDFTYVDDMIEAFLAVGRHDAPLGRVFNFGTGRATSIAELARRIVELTGSRSEIVHDATRAAEVDRLCCDSSRATRELGWSARVSIEEGLERNVAWARES